MYEKTEKYQVNIVPGTGYEVHGQWKDDIHDLRSRIVFDISNFEILEAEAEGYNTPFEICNQGISSIGNIIGAKVGPGFNRLVNQKIMGKEGCVHLGELVINSVKVFLQAASREKPDWIDPDYYAERWLEWISNYRDKCIFFSLPDISQEDIQKAFGPKS